MRTSVARITFILLLCSAAALAVSTSRWKHTSEADFAAGEMDGVVATNLGDLQLSRSVRSILPPDSRVGAVYALAETGDGTIYAATGPDGVLLSIRDEKVSDAATFGDNVSLYSLFADAKGRVFVGTGGERGELWRIDSAGAAAKKIFSAEGVQYVWAIHEAMDGSLYLATGPHGQLFAVDANVEVKDDEAPPAARVIFDSEENNLLCVLGARKETSDGETLYIGTDPHGLLLKIDSKTGEPFVVYDAAETEISALAWDASGDLLAATAQATPDAEAEIAAAAEERGRPDAPGSTGVPIDTLPPENPLPPQPPEPLPGEPKPIPKTYLLRTQDAPTTVPEPESTTATPELSAGAVAGTGAAVEPAVNGNAVYRVDRDGFVREVFRANVSIYSLLRPTKRDGILAATGTGGAMYYLRPAAEETLVLAKVDPKQILSMLNSRDGKTVYLGCANRGDVIAMTGGFAAVGTYTSPVLDAGQISRFGQMRLVGTLPTGSALRVSTRSGNVAEPTAAGWSPWSESSDATEFLQIAAPAARFFQYRLTFVSAAGETNGAGGTPVVREIDVAYQMPNLPPAVSAVRIAAGDATTPDTRPKRTITWEAVDPNTDAMKYTIEFRRVGLSTAAADDRGEAWTTLKKDIDELTFDWDTRTVPDGRYEIRVHASDASANASGDEKSASRVSEPVEVDNTPPAVGDVRVAAGATPDAPFQVTCTVVDRGSTVEKLEFALDGRDDWRLVLPADKMADSPKEAYVFAAVSRENVSPRQIALRATDSLGNQGFATVAVPR